MAKNPKQKRIEELEKENKRLVNVIDTFSHQSRTYPLPQKTKRNTLRFAVIGDTHIGSLFERVDALAEFFKLLKSEKINTVLHAGDMLDGHNVYRGHEFELYALGFEAQKNALIERFPKIQGIETYFITGNHDQSYKNQSGISVGKAISRERSDLHFLDSDMADVKFKVGNTWLKYRLIHPSGGTAYAISYKSQKIIESISGGRKPRAIFIGHYHKADYVPMFRNVRSLQVGAFQSQTPFMAKKPTPAHVGGWIIEDTVSKGLADRFKAEFISFYEPSEK